MNKQKLVLKWLNKEFGNLIPVVRREITYYVDENNLPLFYYLQDETNGWVCINHSRIWVLLESIFSMKDLEIRNLLEVWLKDTYNLRGYEPKGVHLIFLPSLDDTYNLK